VSRDENALSRLAERHWLLATDRADPDSVAAEALYKLGFLNALQIVGLAKGRDSEVKAAIAIAVELVES
jgi:hypothetical protein